MTWPHVILIWYDTIPYDLFHQAWQRLPGGLVDKYLSRVLQSPTRCAHGNLFSSSHGPRNMTLLSTYMFCWFLDSYFLHTCHYLSLLLKASAWFLFFFQTLSALCFQTEIGLRKDIVPKGYKADSPGPGSVVTFNQRVRQQLLEISRHLPLLEKKCSISFSILAIFHYLLLS